MANADSRISFATNGVNFINKNDTSLGKTTGLAKKFSHTTSPHSNYCFLKFRTRTEQEGKMTFTQSNNCRRLEHFEQIKARAFMANRIAKLRAPLHLRAAAN